MGKKNNENFYHKYRRKKLQRRYEKEYAAKNRQFEEREQRILHDKLERERLKVEAMEAQAQLKELRQMERQRKQIDELKRYQERHRAPSRASRVAGAMQKGAQKAQRGMTQISDTFAAFGKASEQMLPASGRGGSLLGGGNVFGTGDMFGPGDLFGGSAPQRTHKHKRSKRSGRKRRR